MKEVIEHYDKLIEENNDPFRDSEPLRAYMDKWDGQKFIDCMRLDKSKKVLEIGVGTGRIADRVAPLCGILFGIDISSKTLERASVNLNLHNNVKLLCGDFVTFEFVERFDVIYSTLTFMHIEDKLSAIRKVAELLNCDGLFVLSIDKNQNSFIDMGTRKIKIYPDTPENTINFIRAAGLHLTDKFETEHAYVFVSKKVVK